MVHFWPFTDYLEKFLMVASQGFQIAGLGLKFHCWEYRGAFKSIICKAQQSDL